MTTLLIDGDSIPWVVSYNCREASYPYEIEEAVDKLMDGLIERSEAMYVVGFLGASGVPTFRHEVATLRPYKGKRGEKPEYFEKWADTVTSYLQSKYLFRLAHVDGKGLAYETDDMIASYARMLRESRTRHTICSADKDLKQIPGTHMNPSKMETMEISEYEGQIRLWAQVLMGDSTDNIPGLPKCGPKGAEKILAGAEDKMDRFQYCALRAYTEYYGEFQGILNFTENYRLVKLLTNIELVEEACYEPSALIL